MKKLICIMIILGFISIQKVSNAQISTQKIICNDVLLATDLLDEMPAKECMEHRIGKELFYYSESQGMEPLVYNNLHSFVASLHYGFADHRPVAISPDMIWLMITQSFAMHINLNPEKYRDQIVAFDGVKNIQIRSNLLLKHDSILPWNEQVHSFKDSLELHLGRKFTETMLPLFSTTKEKEMVAYEIALLDIVSPYFDYSLATECGFLT